MDQENKSIKTVQNNFIYFIFSIKYSMKNIDLFTAIFTFMFIGILTPVNSQRGPNCSYGCATCQIFFYNVYCTKCFPQRYMDYSSGKCLCDYGTYDNGTTCLECAVSCLTCNQSVCTSCSQDKYLLNGACICKNGYGIDQNGGCIRPTTINISLILGASIGAAAGLVCIVSTVVMIKRREDFKIFQGRFENIVAQYRPNPVVLQIQRDYEDSSACGTIIDSKLSKKLEYKIETCSICLEDQPFFMTQCAHFFHEQCIIQWMKKRQNCPNCNHTISKMKIMKWCGSCRQELIRPQCFRINSGKNPSKKDEIPIFWPTCANCQGFDQQIDLKPVSGT